MLTHHEVSTRQVITQFSRQETASALKNPLRLIVLDAIATCRILYIIVSNESITHPNAVLKPLDLILRQHKSLVSMRKPVAQRNTDHSAHDRTSIVHRLASNGQERRERQEDHAVNPPCQSQAVDG